MDWLLGGGVIILMQLFAVEADICRTRSEKNPDSGKFRYILSNPMDDYAGYWHYEKGSYCSCYINLTSVTYISTEVTSVYSSTNLELTKIWDNTSQTEKIERQSDRALLQAMTAERYFSIKIESKEKGSGRIEIYYAANTSLSLICSEEDLIKENPTTPITSLAPTPLGDKGFVSVTSIRDTIVYEEKQESLISLVLILGVSCGVLVLIVIIIGIVLAVKRCPRSVVNHRKGSKSQENPDQRIELVAREGGAVYEEIAEAFAESDRQESENEYDVPDVMRGLDVYAEIPGPVGNETGYATAASPGSVEGTLKGKEGTVLQSELPKPSPIPFQIQ